MRLPLAPTPNAPLPALHARWVEEALGALPPEESLSTCDTCVQLPKPGEEPGPGQFDPRTKCCTYLPVLHNYQVGALLEDPAVDPAGLATVEARIDRGVGVTTLGLIGDPEFFRLYQQADFGKDPALLCPHYLEAGGGRCGVWEHRNATCSAWFCRFDRGSASWDFWRLGMMTLLRAIEDVMSRWAVQQLGAAEGDFGRWGGDVRAFYRESARLAGRCSWALLEALGGAPLREVAEDARRLHRALLAAPLVTESVTETVTGMVTEVTASEGAPR